MTMGFLRRHLSISFALIVLGCLLVLFLLYGKRDPLRDLESVRVVRILDGDTVELADGRIVRLIGIDTPEKGQPGADSATMCNTALVLGRTVRLEYGHERSDRYGRTLAYLYADGRMVNREILNAGWAYCYFFEKNLKHGRELVQALDSAMIGHRGLWRAAPGNCGSLHKFKLWIPIPQTRLSQRRRYQEGRDRRLYGKRFRFLPRFQPLQELRPVGRLP